MNKQSETRETSRAIRAGLTTLVLLSSLCACSEFGKQPEEAGIWAKEQVISEERDQRKAAAGATAEPATGEGEATPAQEDRAKPRTQVARGPGVRRRMAMTDVQAEKILPELIGDPIQVGYSNIPLPAFINTVFGEQLSLPYSLDPALAKQTDLVTLRLVEPISPQDLFRIARRTLMDYGVAMRLDEGVYVFYIDKDMARGDIPILVSGSALPDVPDSHRPVFMFVPLDVVKPRQVKIWLEQSLQGRDIEVDNDITSNAIVLRGKAGVVEQALGMIRLLDQPHMRGKYSASIEPAFVEVSDLADDLVGILKSEGYDATLKPPGGSVVLLPLNANNQLVIFAPNEEVLAHVQRWVRIIDRRQKLSIKDGVFTYSVKNTYAGYIVNLLNALDGGRSAELDAVSAAGPVEGQETRSATLEVRSGSSFVVDSNRNAIIFRGSGQAWSELLPVIQEMDQLSPSVLIEVLLAEISLNDTESSSFEFLAKGSVDGYGLTYGTLDLLDSGTAAFQSVLDKAGETRAILKLLYENRRAEIRSRPRLMVKSGQLATIDVGDEVPVVTTSSQSVTDPGAPLVQNIVYRNTGVRLEIKPIVHNSGYVDVEVSQEISEAEINETSGIDSPTIRNRKVQTTVTLRDGGSILLGGLISSTSSDVEKGVPLLGKLPGLGALFKSQGTVTERRELIMMITPYVLKTPEDGQELTELMTVSDSL